MEKEIIGFCAKTDLTNWKKLFGQAEDIPVFGRESDVRNACIGRVAVKKVKITIGRLRLTN